MANKKKKSQEAGEEEVDYSKMSNEELEQIIKEAEQEIEDMEALASKESQYRFVPPPKSHKENLKVLSEVDARYEMSKRFLDGKGSESYYKDTPQKKISEKELNSRLPPNFLISNLVYPKTNTDIILCGVDRYSYLHANMLSDILTKISPGLIFTQIAPDEPFLIRKSKNFKDPQEKFIQRKLDKLLDENYKGFKLYWREFITGKQDASFYVNPGPHYLVDTIILKNKCEKIIDENLVPCDDIFDIGANIAYSHSTELRGNDLYPDCFLTPLVHQYNNMNQNTQLVIGGYPILALRDQVVRNYESDELESHLNTMIHQYADSNLGFDPQYLMIDHCINPQVCVLT